jgi:hypothetical protein
MPKTMTPEQRAYLKETEAAAKFYFRPRTLVQVLQDLREALKDLQDATNETDPDPYGNDLRPARLSQQTTASSLTGPVAPPDPTTRRTQ